MEDFTEENLDTVEQESMLADDAVPVCPNCLEACDPLDNYCQHCGSNEAINPLASYMPFVDLRFKVGMFGKLWRKAVSGNTAIELRILYMGLFILFMPYIFLFFLFFSIFEKIFVLKKNS